jgi:hypothetical protein
MDSGRGDEGHCKGYCSNTPPYLNANDVCLDCHRRIGRMQERHSKSSTKTCSIAEHLKYSSYDVINGSDLNDDTLVYVMKLALPLSALAQRIGQICHQIQVS